MKFYELEEGRVYNVIKDGAVDAKEEFKVFGIDLLVSRAGADDWYSYQEFRKNGDYTVNFKSLNTMDFIEVPIGKKRFEELRNNPVIINNKMNNDFTLIVKTNDCDYRNFKNKMNTPLYFEIEDDGYNKVWGTLSYEQVEELYQYSLKVKRLQEEDDNEVL